MNVNDHHDDEDECFLVFVRYGHSLVTECYQTRHPFVHITQAQVGGGRGGEEGCDADFKNKYNINTRTRINTKPNMSRT